MEGEQNPEQISLMNDHNGNQTAGLQEQTRMKKKRLYCILPFFTAVFIVASFFISYAVASGEGNVKGFTFISYTGVKVPERCIFSFLVNIGTFLLGASMLLRYLQQREQLRIMAQQFTHTARVRRLCIAALVVGLLSPLGLAMVANFQIDVMKYPHYVGALFAFLFGVVYAWIQTCISFHQRPRRWIAVVQLLCSIFLFLSFVALMISFIVFMVKRDPEEGTKEAVSSGPWYWASVISEWVLAISVVSFLFTFCPPFSRVTHSQFLEDRTDVTANDNTHRTNLSRNGDIAV